MALEGIGDSRYPKERNWLVANLEIGMAFTKWVTARTQYCDRVKTEAELQEHRVYPADVLPDFPGYRVIARRCSKGTACNLAGFKCKWSFANPSYDPFEPPVT